MISFNDFKEKSGESTGKIKEPSSINESAADRTKEALEKVNEIVKEIMEVIGPDHKLSESVIKDEAEKESTETLKHADSDSEDQETEEESEEESEETNEGYILYRDKQENFVCDISIEGAKMNQSEARIIVESEDWNLVFPGKIIGNKCTVPLKKMSIFEDGFKGKIRLEIIAEDTLFVPWEENFTVKTSKKVAVKVNEKQNVLPTRSAKIKINNIR